MTWFDQCALLTVVYYVPVLYTDPFILSLLTCACSLPLYSHSMIIIPTTLLPVVTLPLLLLFQMPFMPAITTYFDILISLPTFSLLLDALMLYISLISLSL